MSRNIAIILCANQDRNFPISNYLLHGKSIHSYIVDALKYHDFDQIYLSIDDYNSMYYISNDYKTLSIKSDKIYSLHSLCSVRINEKFDNLFIIDGNIFFDRYGISELISNKEENAAIISNPRYSDYYFTPLIKNGGITSILQSNNIKPETKELLGLYKISYNLYLELIKLYDDDFIFSIEDALLYTNKKIASIYIDDYVCYKIKDEHDLPDLINIIEPRIKRIYNNKNDEFKIRDLVKSTLNKKILLFKSLGGMTNKNYYIQSNDKSQYVIRLPGNGTNSLINRYSEMDNTFIAGSLGIDIAPDFFCSKSGVKITPFINDAETLNSDTIKLYSYDCIHLIRKLHLGQKKFKNIFNIKEEVDKYFNVIKNKNYYDGLSDIKGIVFSFIDKYKDNQVYFTSCHNDTVAENFIKSSNKFYLIDWEYAALNDPMWDLAALFIENNFSSTLINKALNSYFEREPNDSELKRLKLCYLYQDLLWTLWSIVKCEAGTNYYEYGLKRFLRLKDNIRLFDDL